MGEFAERLFRARALFERGDLKAADDAYCEVLALEPGLVMALRARAEIAVARRDPAAALELVERSLGPAMAEVPSQASRPVRVLQLGSIHPGAHANTDRVLNPSWTRTTTLLMEKWDIAWPLPEADIVINVIADADICAPALELAAHACAGTAAPVLNDPTRVLRTTRVENARRLAHIGGLRVARTERLSKDEAGHRSTFPFLLRAPGFHNGANFEMVESFQTRESVLESLPAGDVLAIEFLDTRGLDGSFRKYRAMAIDGRLYPAHLAIGEAWKLHYFSSSMNDERRAEEASYLAGMRSHIGERAYGTLEKITAELGLDYFGMDYTVDAAGEVTLFEANASMTVYLPEERPENAYRRRAVLAIDGALENLIRERISLP